MKRMYEKKFDINTSVLERLKYLYRIKDEISKELEKAPEGNLLVSPCSDKRNYRYYVRYRGNEKLGTYLDKSKQELKTQLAAKKYNCILLKSVCQEIKKLEKVNSLNIYDSLVDTFCNLNMGLKRLIAPVNIDDQTFIRKWESEGYAGLGFEEDDSSEYYSDKGERMRSKSELLIANSLFKYGIPYKYEMPVYRNNGNAFYPDFTVLHVRERKEIYWEHLGKMGNYDYVERNLWKLGEYRKLGIFLGDNLIITYESATNSVGTKEIERIIHKFIL